MLRGDLVSQKKSEWHGCCLNGRQVCVKWTLMNLEDLEFSEQ